MSIQAGFDELATLELRRVIREATGPRALADVDAAVEANEGSPPRLVFVNRYFYPDVSATSQMLFDIASRLVKRGYEVHVVCSRQLYGDPDAALPERDVVHGVQVHRIRTCRFGRARLLGRACDYVSFYFSALLALPAIVRRGDVLIAKTDPPLISLVAAIVARLRGAHLINWLQDVFPEVAAELVSSGLPGWLDAALRRLRDASLRAADKNVVLGSRMQRHFLDRRIADDKLSIIENWADESPLPSFLARETKLRAQLSLQEKFVVAYSGNLGRAHEYRTILHTAEALRHRDDIVFLMIGGGALMEPLRAAARQRDLSNFVFIDYRAREALADSLATADVHLACLLPSLEGLIVPSKFYGIIAAARPVAFIGDRDGELARIIETNGCGVAVALGDSGLLAEELVRMKDNDGWRLSMGANARALFERKYTVEKALEKWLKMLDEVVAERSSTTGECLSKVAKT